MKLVTFSIPDRPPRPGMLVSDSILPLPFVDMLEFVKSGESGLQQARQAAQDSTKSERFPLNQVRLHAPLPRPSSLRDFYAFEEHVANARALRGSSVPPEWYELAIFYFSNHTAIYGPGDIIPYPYYSQALDYELEIACVINAAGQDIPVEKAAEYIFGFMIFNDWSARDEQRKEMRLGLGPAKGKDFASSFGPWIVTPDEIQTRATDRPGVYDLAMRAWVNGELLSQGNFNSIYHSTAALIARASQAVQLHPGDILGSGTVGNGCLLELTRGQGPWLQPGDVVELEIEFLGKLTNTVGAPVKPPIYQPLSDKREVQE